MIVVLALLCACSFYTIAIQPKPLTTNQIHQRVAQQFEGKIVSTQYSPSSNVYIINLLQRDGKVHRLLFDATTGQLVSHSPNAFR